MGLKCGIIGLPNVGKSTLFNILTNSKIPAKNFPFCTIKPNTGVVPVFDNRLNVISKIVHPKNIITAFMECVDIAGLVKGASHGSGLGNQFLSNIRHTDLLIHVVRCFHDTNIMHVHNTIDPIYDIDIINMELILSDLQLCKSEIIRLKKKKIYNNKISLLESCLDCLDCGNTLRQLSLKDQDLSLIYDMNFITLKPMIYIANTSNSNNYTEKLLHYLNKNNNICIVVNIFQESKDMYFKLQYTNSLYSEKQFYSSINDIISTGYKLLGLQTFFTVGTKEVRAWTIQSGENSMQAARTIHTDFQKGFIRAQVISYIDFVKFKYESELRKFGKIRLEGKNYLVQDGDIIKFLFKV